MVKETNTDCAGCGPVTCPAPPPEIAATLSVLSGKWKVLIIWTLYRGKSRFNALKRGMAGITQYTLTGQLRELEAEGIVAREIFAEVPLRVEYSLTEHGKTLGRVLRVLTEWGYAHLAVKKQLQGQPANPPAKRDRFRARSAGQG